VTFGTVKQTGLLEMPIIQFVAAGEIYGVTVLYCITRRQMKEKNDGKLTVQVAATIPKTLHSRDSADRLVRAVVNIWRERPRTLRKSTRILELDFKGIEYIANSAASALIEFRNEFSEDKRPAVEFSNLSNSMSKIFEAEEKRLRLVSKGTNAQKKKPNGFLIEV